MAIPFYDDNPLEPDAEGWVDIERIYCFEWESFDASHRELLQAIFRSLPHYVGSQSWYSSTDDIENGYLAASIEPPGLQVFGTLPVAEWEKWDQAFQAAIRDLPPRRIKRG